MTDLADNLYIRLRDDVWYYCRRVPTELIPVLGKKFIKKSLKVTDCKAAKQLRSVVDLETNALFAQAELKLATTLNDTPELNAQHKSDLFILLAANALSRLNRIQVEELLEDPPETDDELEQIIEDTEYQLQILNSPSDPRKLLWQLDFVDEAQGGDPDKNAIVRIGPKYLEISRRALSELAKRKIASLVNNDVPFTPNPLFL